jgi:hypothetical protein
MQRRTLRGWFEYLDDSKRELTESEFMALMLFNTREYARVTMELTKGTKEAAEHTEGMVGAIDQLAAGLAERSGIPYASSGAVRAALDARRDGQRRLGTAAQAEASPVP